MIKAWKKGFRYKIGGGKARKSMVLAEDVARFLPIVGSFGGIFILTEGYYPNFRKLSYSLSKRDAINLPLSVARM